MRRPLAIASAVVCGCVLVAGPNTSAAGTSARAASAVAGGVAGCPMFPPDNIWNARVDALPRDPNSDAYVATIGRDAPAHPDFGSGTWQGAPIGIPYASVPGSQPRVPVSFQYADESDPGPYPIPADAPIEGGSASSGDRHVLVVETATCTLYELYAAYPHGDGSWRAGSGAVFPLLTNALRPADWTSADAAGLPILPGLVRYDEVAAGGIDHAVRFTAPRTRRSYVWPGRHFASSLTDARYPPMGQRFRLRASVDVTRFSPQPQAIARALREYGMILADNGSAWFITGAPDERWDNEELAELGRLRGADFEAVDVSSLQADADSGQVRGAAATPTSPATATRLPAASPTADSTATPGPRPTDDGDLVLPRVCLPACYRPAAPDI